MVSRMRSLLGLEKSKQLWFYAKHNTYGRRPCRFPLKGAFLEVGTTLRGHSGPLGRVPPDSLRRRLKISDVPVSTLNLLKLLKKKK